MANGRKSNRQSQRRKEEEQKRLMRQRERLNDIIVTAARWAGGFGGVTVFIPLADIFLMVVIWTKLLIDVAEELDHRVDEQYAKKFAWSVAKGTLLFLGGSKLGTFLLHLIPFAGSVAAIGVNASLNYGYTWLLGQFLVKQFSSPDFDLTGMATAAGTFLLGFSISEVQHLRDLHDTGTMMADLHQTPSALGDLHQAGTLMADPHHSPIDVAHHGFGHGYPLHEVAHHGFGHGYSVAFSGQTHTEAIAGFQGHDPYCGIHAVGNMVQMSHPGVGEGVNDSILNIAGAHGGLVAQNTGWTLNLGHYEPMLEQVFHVPVHWGTYNPSVIKELLYENHGILAVGDAHHLDAELYPQPNSWHAFNITDVKEEAGRVWYKGLDSNKPGEEVWWPGAAVRKAMAASRAAYGTNVLVTDNAVAWPWKT